MSLYIKYAYISDNKSRYYSSILKITGFRTNHRGQTIYLTNHQMDIDQIDDIPYRYIVLEVPGTKSRNPQICLSIDNVIILTADQLLHRLDFKVMSKYFLPSLIDWQTVREQHLVNFHTITH